MPLYCTDMQGAPLQTDQLGCMLCTHGRKHTYLHTHTHTHMYTCVHTQHVCTCTFGGTCSHIHMLSSLPVHTHTHGCTHMYTHTWMHIHTACLQMLRSTCPHIDTQVHPHMRNTFLQCWWAMHGSIWWAMHGSI